MEYLMTYGWALLIIVVVGAALFALGILNPSTYTQSRCTGFQYFTFQDQKVAGPLTNTTTLDLLNGPRDITVDGLTVDGTSATSVSTAPSGTISAGSRFTVTGTFPTGKQSGDSYSYDVSVAYDVTSGIQNNLDQGTCTGKVQ